MKIVVTGSIAYDNIMDFPGYFREHILPEKIHMLSVSFLVDTLKKQRGGTAGNICYTLALLGSRPSLFSSAGQDFDDYARELARVGVDVSTVNRVADEFTATCYITTDRDNNQIVGFYPGAMTRDADISLTSLGLTPDDLVIISATGPESIVRFAAECRALEVPFIFAPAQQIIRLSGEDLVNGVTGAKVIIVNDYEFEMIRNKTGLSQDDLLERAEIVIGTRGKEGSVIRTRDGMIEIPIALPTSVEDPTGAGDAYIAGIVHGLTRGFSLEQTGRIAALAAVYAIERYGTQAHDYSRADFARRYAESFGEQIDL